jgi:hypothetical protein
MRLGAPAIRRRYVFLWLSREMLAYRFATPSIEHDVAEAVDMGLELWANDGRGYPPSLTHWHEKRASL